MLNIQIPIPSVCAKICGKKDIFCLIAIFVACQIFVPSHEKTQDAMMKTTLPMLYRSALFALGVVLIGAFVPAGIWFRGMAFGDLKESPGLQEKTLRWLTSFKNGTAPLVTNEMIETFHRDGFLVVRNAFNQEEVDLLKDYITHVTRFPNLEVSLLAPRTCTAFSFSTGNLIPELGAILNSLPVHASVAKIMGAERLTLVNDILHWNPFNCERVGAILSTHSDMNTAPFSIERRHLSEGGYFGDNSIVLWAALDELGNETMTMHLSRGSHRAFEQSKGKQTPFSYDRYCEVIQRDLDKEAARDSAFLDSFVALPTLHPGDAILFSGLVYHRPMPVCKGGCHVNNTRRITIRYVDSDRTSFRNDVESSSTHPMTRNCPSILAGGSWLNDCKLVPGESVKEHAKNGLPIVFPPREVSYDIESVIESLKERKSLQPKIPPWQFFVAPGHRVHHGVCDLEKRMATITARRILQKFSPSLQRAIFGGEPPVRPGEEAFFKPL